MLKKFSCVFGHTGLDCGAAALATVARHYGLRVSLAQVANLMEYDLQGVTLATLAEAAEALGFETSIGVAKRDAVHEIPLPAIALLNDKPIGHYVVLHKVSQKSVLIADPSTGPRTCAIPDFMQRWKSRYILLLRPRGPFTLPLKKPYDLMQLLKLVHGELKHPLLAALLALVTTTLGFVMSYFVQLIVDRAIPTSNRTLLAALGYGALVIVTAKAISSYSRRSLLDKFGRRIEFNLRLRYVKALLMVPMRFISTHYTGDLFNRFLDVMLIRTAVVGTGLSMMLDIFFLFGCGLAMLWYSPLLTFVAFLCVPLMFFVAWWSAGYVMSSERQYRQAESEVSSLFINILENIRLLKAYACEQPISERIASAYGRSQNIMSKCERIFRVLEAISNFSTSAWTVVLLWLGAYLVLDGSITVGKLMFFFSVSGLLLGTADRIIPSIPVVQKAVTSFERLDEILQTSPEISKSCAPSSAYRQAGEITISGLDFWYRRGSPVLSNLSLHISPHEIVAIVGETGSGKTTLANLLVGLESPKSGCILIDGADLTMINKAELRRRVSVVFQESTLLNASILENITLGGGPYSKEDVVKACRMAMIHDFILSLPHEYESPVGSSGLSLSSGQRQRIAIARALLRNPAILILDEATSNLDSETESQVLRAVMSEICHRTTIVITHRLTTAKYADRILVLNGGGIAECGSHQELILKRGKYHFMWKAFEGDKSALVGSFHS
ncbi:MAG: peptidase domain-containing ABC transporter [Candidatus Acidiferrum sp.]